MKVGLTGYSGFIGSMLLQLLIKNSSIDEIHLIGRSKPKIQQSSKINHYYFDLVSSSNTFEKDLDVLIHLAAKFRKKHIDAITPKEYFDANTFGTYNLIKHVKTKRILYASTVDVYGNNSYGARIDEKIKPEPANVYATTKYFGEQICEFFSNKNDLIIARIGNVYGPRDESEKLIKTAIDKIGKGYNIDMYGDGTYTRDYIFINDVSRLLMKLSLSNESGIVNLVSGNDYSILETLKIICSLLKVKFNDKVNIVPVENCPRSIRFNNSRLKNIIGEFYFTKLSEGVQKTIGKSIS